ncbi:MAG TPA: hypothetical protein VFC19_31775 [Candidatus Limnocylindrales bacterium]|nr:hypothetical protein [Candidatus Limnocylindrales bacterium]
MTTDPYHMVATMIAALESLPPAQRALAAGALIAAVQGEGDRRITRIRRAAIAQMHEQGMTEEDIAHALVTSIGAIDLAIQSHRRFNTVSASA